MVLFVLMVNIPFNQFSVMSGCFPVPAKCLAQKQNTVPRVKSKPIYLLTNNIPLYHWTFRICDVDVKCAAFQRDQA